MPSLFAGIYSAPLQLETGAKVPLISGGVFLTGASVQIVLAGTSTPAAVYASNAAYQAGTPALANPLPYTATSGGPGVDAQSNCSFYADAYLSYDALVTYGPVSGLITVAFRIPHLTPDAHPPIGTTTGTVADGGVVATNTANIATNATAITNEVTRATNAEGVLRTTISGLAATAWLANTAYIAETIVTNGAILWQAPSGGVPARSTFTSSDWIELASIALPVGTTSGTVAAGDDTRIVTVDAAANVASRRTLGTGPNQAAQGSTSVQIGADLGGTPSAPTVAKIQGTAIGAPTGDTGHFLAGDGSWQVPPGGGTPVQAVAGGVTVAGPLVVNKHNPVNASAGAVGPMTLPTGQPVGSFVNVAKGETDATKNTVTVTGNMRGVPAQTITLSLVKESVLFLADAAGSWWPFADHKPLSSLDGRYVTQLGASNGTDDSPTIQAAIDAAAAIATVTGSQAVVRGMSGVTYQTKFSGPLTPMPIVGSVYPAVVMASNVVLDSINFNAPDWGTAPHLTNNVAVIAAPTGTNNWAVRRCGFNGNAPTGLATEYGHTAISFGSCTGVTISNNTCKLFRAGFVGGLSVGNVTVSTTLTNGAASGTTLAVSALLLAIPAGGLFTVNDQVGHNQSFVVPAGAAAGATSLTITSATVTLTTGSGYWGWGTTWPCSFVRILDNDITQCYGGAIKIAAGVTDCWIERNTCVDNLGIISGTYSGSEVIYLNDSKGINARLHINGNHVANWGACVVLGGCLFGEISGNYLSAPGAGNAINCESTVFPLGSWYINVSITKNLILGPPTNVAISFIYSQNVRVEGNIFWGQYVNPVFINETQIAVNNAYFNNTLALSPLGSGTPRVIIHAGSTSQVHTIGTLQVGSHSFGGQTTILSPGAAGTVLTSAGTSAVPTWTAGTPGPASWTQLVAWNSATTTYTSNAPSGPASLVLRGQYTYVANAASIPANTDPASETTTVGGVGAHWTCIAGPGPQGSVGPPGSGTTFPYGPLSGAPALVAGNDQVPYYAQDTKTLYQIENISGTYTLVPIGVGRFNDRQGTVTLLAADLVGLVPPAPTIVTAATLSAPLSTGGAITSIPINALGYAASTGNTFSLSDAAGHSQAVTLSGAVAAGATALPVNSFTPNFAYPTSGTYVIPTSLSVVVPAGAGHVKVSAVGGGGAGGGGGAMGIATESTTLTNGSLSGATLTVTALPQSIPSGGTIVVDDGAGHTQNFTTTSLSAAGAVSVAITSATVTLNTGSGYKVYGSAWAQIGGPGAGSGASNQQMAAVTPGAVLTFTSGGVVASPGAGGIVAVSNAGSAGGAGGNGPTVAVTGSGLAMSCPGGKGAVGGPANSIAATVGGAYGGAVGTTNATAAGLPGSGGTAAVGASVGSAGGPPVGLSPRGGGAGGAASPTNGGVGGGAASVGAGGSGTSSGTTSANPTLPGQGGDGGGGGASGGAGGSGTTGTPGQALYEWLP